MITRSTRGMRCRNISRAETWSVNPEGWSETDDEDSQVDNNFTLKKMVNGCQRSEEFSFQDTVMRHLRGDDS